MYVWVCVQTWEKKRVTFLTHDITGGSGYTPGDFPGQCCANQGKRDPGKQSKVHGFRWAWGEKESESFFLKHAGFLVIPSKVLFSSSITIPAHGHSIPYTNSTLKWNCKQSLPLLCTVIGLAKSPTFIGWFKFHPLGNCRFLFSSQLTQYRKRQPTTRRAANFP